MAKKRDGGSRGTALKRVKNYIRGRSKKGVLNVWALMDARGQLNPEAYPALISWVKSAFHDSTAIPRGALPDYSSFIIYEIDRPITLEKEIAWAVALINTEPLFIEKFLKLKATFEVALLENSLDLAESYLQELKTICGSSLWLIETEIAFLQHKYGLERQKQYAKGLNENNPNSLAAVVAYHTSARNEVSVSAPGFVNSFRKRVTNWSTSSTVQEYILHRIEGSLGTSQETLANIARVNTSLSLVDSYEGLVKILQHLCLSNQNVHNTLEIRHILKNINNFDDYRIDKLLMILGETTYNQVGLPVRNLQLDNLVLQGRINEAVVEAEHKLAYGNLSPSEYRSLAYARSFSHDANRREEPASLSERIVKNLTHVYRSDNYFTEAANDLLKIGLNWKTLPFASGLYQDNYRSQDVIISLLKGPVQQLFGYPELEPQFAAIIGEGHKRSYLEALEDDVGNQAATEYVRRALNIGDQTPLSGLSIEAQRMSELTKAMLEGDYEHIFDVSRELLENSDASHRKEAALFELTALLETHRLGDALDRIASLYLEHSTPIEVLPLHKAIHGKNDFVAYFASHQHQISLSIVLDLYLKVYEDEDQASNLRAAWDEFLLSNDVERPSQLLNSSAEFSKTHLIYFLRHVCVPSVMDVSTNIDTSQGILEERINVCLVLLTLDPINSDAYHQEIIELTKALRIQQGQQQFDRSRVHVDTEGLTNWAHRELEETFKRYRDLLSAGVESEDVEFDEAALRFLKQEAPLPARYLEVPKAEGDEILTQLVGTLFDNFINNPEFGLDSYLSLRIRHGSLSGQLRKPLENLNLITVKRANGQYWENIHWLSQLTNVSAVSKLDTSRAFDNFAKAYDNVIADLNQEVVRVRSKGKPKGAFFPQMNSLMFHALKSQIRRDESFDEFLEACLELFWAALYPSLRELKRRFEEDIKFSLLELIRQLEVRIHSLVPDEQCLDLRSALVTASTEVQRAVDEAADWFDERRVNIDVNYTFEEIIDIAIATAKRTNNERNLDLHIYIESDVSKVSRYSSDNIIDILHIIFGNIYGHSGIVEQPLVHLNLTASGEEERFTLRVENELGSQLPNHPMLEKLERIKALIESNDYKEYQTLEGGTGLLKLKRLITPSVDSQSTLKFGFTDEQRFYVEIVMSLTSIAEMMPSESVEGPVSAFENVDH